MKGSLLQCSYVSFRSWLCENVRSCPSPDSADGPYPISVKVGKGKNLPKEDSWHRLGQRARPAYYNLWSPGSRVSYNPCRPWLPDIAIRLAGAGGCAPAVS
jgi:hypothetical protein